MIQSVFYRFITNCNKEDDEKQITIEISAFKSTLNERGASDTYLGSRTGILVPGPVGSLTFHGAVGDGLAASAAFQVIARRLAAIPAAFDAFFRLRV